MKPQKLKSGSWNVMVYSHVENGRRKYVSITAPTKAECELKAAEFKSNKRRIVCHDLTVRDAIEGYIKAKEPVLSPSTIRGYRIMIPYYEEIGHKRIRTLTSEDIQLFVSDLSLRVSPKSVRNIYGLLNTSIGMYAPDLSFRVTLPAKKRKRPVSPSDEAIRKLLSEADETLRFCILLGIRGLRRGEISALKYEDVKDGVAHVHADMVKGPDGWVYKEIPKTEDSDRYVRIPDPGTGEGYIVKWCPDSITKRFIDLRNKCGYDFPFHQLRHYFASAGVVLGIPELYMADMGGWNRGGSSAMRSIYQNNIRAMSDYYAEQMEDHLKKLEGTS